MGVRLDSLIVDSEDLRTVAICLTITLLAAICATLLAAFWLVSHNTTTPVLSHMHGAAEADRRQWARPAARTASQPPCESHQHAASWEAAVRECPPHAAVPRTRAPRWPRGRLAARSASQAEQHTPDPTNAPGMRRCTRGLESRSYTLSSAHSQPARSLPRRCAACPGAYCFPPA